MTNKVIIQKIILIKEFERVQAKMREQYEKKAEEDSEYTQKGAE